MFGNLKQAMAKAEAIANKMGVDLPGSKNNSQEDIARQQQQQSTHSAPAGQAQKVGAVTGRRRALLIGVNYTGTKAELRGCINDVRNLHAFIRTHGFQDCRLLIDDAQDPSLQPTRANMTEGMRWLMAGAQAGDSLFLHFSGHGSRQRDTDGDEADGYDETVCPVDYERAGMISDDDLFELIVLPLPQGTRLTVVFDCCHSGSTLDLPFMYLGDGSEHEMPSKKFGKFFFEAGVQYLQGNKRQAFMSLVGGVRGIISERGAGGSNGGIMGSLMSKMSGGSSSASVAKTQDGVGQVGQKHAPGDVFYFSGCRDEQTSADAVIGGNATGAMSHALLQALNQRPQSSYRELLAGVREILKNKYQQVPQMSTSRHVDLNGPFTI